MKRLVGMVAMATCILASPASSEFIYRYKSGYMPNVSVPQHPVDPSTPSVPTDPTGPTNPTTPTDPVDPNEPTNPGGSPSDESCVYEQDGVESKDGDWCEIYRYNPPFDDAPEPGFMMERIAPPANANLETFAYRCVRAAGGWGNYSLYVSSTKLRGIMSMDLVPHSTPNVPARGSVADGPYPMSAPNVPGYLHVTREQEFCLRLEVDDEEEEVAFEVEIYGEDWPDAAVSDGLADHGSYWSSSSVVARFGFNGGDDDPHCPYENCGPGSEEPESPETSVAIPCPEDLEELVSPYSCISSEVSVPKDDPDNTPVMTLAWLPTPAGASADYAYRCFRVGGGGGNYVINAEDKDVSQWVDAVSIVPYSTPNASGGSTFYDIYPDATFDEDWNYWTIATRDTDFCARLRPDPAVTERPAITFEILVEDYSGKVVNGDRVNLDATRDSYIRALTTIDGERIAH